MTHSPEAKHAHGGGAAAVKRTPRLHASQKMAVINTPVDDMEELNTMDPR